MLSFKGTEVILTNTQTQPELNLSNLRLPKAQSFKARPSPTSHHHQKIISTSKSFSWSVSKLSKAWPIFFPLAYRRQTKFRTSLLAFVTMHLFGADERASCSSIRPRVWESQVRIPQSFVSIVCSLWAREPQVWVTQVQIPLALQWVLLRGQVVSVAQLFCVLMSTAWFN